MNLTVGGEGIGSAGDAIFRDRSESTDASLQCRSRRCTSSRISQSLQSLPSGRNFSPGRISSHRASFSNLSSDYISQHGLDAGHYSSDDRICRKIRVVSQEPVAGHVRFPRQYRPSPRRLLKSQESVPDFSLLHRSYECSKDVASKMRSMEPTAAAKAKSVRVKPHLRVPTRAAANRPRSHESSRTIQPPCLSGPSLI